MSLAVAIVRTTSTSFISGTGLKKCSPRKRFGRFFERSLLRQFCQRLLNPGKTLVEKFLFDFENSDTEPRSGRDLGNARAHQPAAKNADFLDIHTFPLTQRTQGNTEEIEIPV